MLYKLVVPSTADGSLNVSVLNWRKKQGDPVIQGEDLIDIKTEKITLYVTSPCNGTLTEILINAGSQARVGDELGSVEGN
jgi:2-oxoglutarate dehydrogenase E2 component (dihydrolipoamide succinyltransferase)